MLRLLPFPLTKLSSARPYVVSSAMSSDCSVDERICAMEPRWLLVCMRGSVSTSGPGSELLRRSALLIMPL